LCEEAAPSSELVAKSMDEVVCYVSMEFSVCM
jgi:hypothetical protein